MRCGLAVSPGKPRVPHCEKRPGAAHSRRDQNVYFGLAGEPRKTAIITGTVPLKPHYKGVESVWGVRARQLSPCQVDRHSQLSGAQAVT